MAGNSVIGALRVVLGADTAAFDKGLKDSQAGLTSFGLGVAAVAAGVAAAAYSIAGSIKAAITSADQLNSLSQSAGISVEQLSKLSYAAGLSDIGMDALAGSLGRLTKSMGSVAREGAGPAAQAFAAMGISVKNQDGTLKASGDVLGEIANKFASYQDGAAKTSLAIAIFGDAGARMIPLLNQGRDGLDALGNEAERFGLVLDQKTTLSAAAFSENLKKMDAVQQGIYVTLTAKLLPSFELLSDQLLEGKKNSTLMTQAAEGLASIINAVVRQIIIAKVELTGFGTQVAALARALADMFTARDWGSMVKVWTDYKSAAEESGKVIALAADALSQFGTKNAEATNTADWLAEGQAIKSLSREVAAYTAVWKAAAPVIGAADSGALQSFLDSQKKRTAAVEAEAETVGKSTGEQAKLRLEYEAGAIALAKNIPLTDEWKQKISAAGDAAAAAAQKLQGANLTQEALAPWELRNQKLAQYNALLAANPGLLNAITIASLKLKFPSFTAAAQAAADFGAQVDILATNALNGLASTLASVITGAKSAGEAFKAFGLQVVTWLIEMIVKALLFKVVMAAIGFFTAPVAAVAEIPLAGTGALYASGGHVNGPGTGTSDSIPAMLSDGEFVVNAQSARRFPALLDAINKGGVPAFANGGAVSNVSVPQVAQVINVSGLGRGKTYTYQDAIEMIKAINVALGQNYKLNVKPA